MKECLKKIKYYLLMRGRYIIFDSVQLLHYKNHRTNFRRDGSYIDSPDLIKTKKNQKFAK